jgi:hypothetical protein
MLSVVGERPHTTPVGDFAFEHGQQQPRRPGDHGGEGWERVAAWLFRRRGVRHERFLDSVVDVDVGTLAFREPLRVVFGVDSEAPGIGCDLEEELDAVA